MSDTDYLAVWGATQEQARAAARHLRLNPRQVLALGNRSADAVRGRAITGVLILPGADSADVDAMLHVACSTSSRGRGVMHLDLRAVSTS